MKALLDVTCADNDILDWQQEEMCNLWTELHSFDYSLATFNFSMP